MPRFRGANERGRMENVRTSEELGRLDEFLEQLGGETEAQCELLREHLEAARTYLVGSMPAEFELSLQMAREALNCVSNRELRLRLEDFIQDHSMKGT